MLTKVQKWGNSQGLRVAKALLDEAGIHVGDEVDVSARKGRIVVEPVSRIRGRYDLRGPGVKNAWGVPARGARLGAAGR